MKREIEKREEEESINKRQWRYRLKNNLCWDCNIKLERCQSLWARKCPKCKQIYPESVLLEYKRDLEKIRYLEG